VLPIFVLAAVFVGVLLTYPFYTLAIGSLTYLALIPLSAYRYFHQERQVELKAKAQNGKGTETEAVAATASSRRKSESGASMQK